MSGLGNTSSVSARREAPGWDPVESYDRALLAVSGAELAVSQPVYRPGPTLLVFLLSAALVGASLLAEGFTEGIESRRSLSRALEPVLISPLADENGFLRSL